MPLDYLCEPLDFGGKVGSGRSVLWYRRDRGPNGLANAFDFFAVPRSPITKPTSECRYFLTPASDFLPLGSDLRCASEPLTSSKYDTNVPAPMTVIPPQIQRIGKSIVPSFSMPPATSLKKEWRRSLPHQRQCSPSRSSAVMGRIFTRRGENDGTKIEFRFVSRLSSLKFA